MQIAIHRSPGPFVAFCPQFSLQLCSLAASLVPARKQVGLVWINETRSLPARTRVRDGFSRDPPLNGSLGHPELERNFSDLHPLFLQRHDVLIPSHSLGLTNQLRVLDSSCLGRVPFFRHLPPFLFF